MIARVGQQPVDLGALLAIGTPSGHGESVIVRVVQLSERDARVVQADAGRDEGVNHGDPVAFVPTL